MLYYDRIYVFEWIDVNIQANQKSAIFVTKFQVTLNNMSAMGHDLLMMSMSLIDISGADYHRIINGIN